MFVAEELIAVLPAIGTEAPDFDLVSTEDVVLMLRDEVPRSPVLLFFFSGSADGRAELAELERHSPRLAAKSIKLLGISERSLVELKALQQELRLSFPLLHDDRGFSRSYGVAAEAGRVLVLVDRNQRIAWIGSQLENLGAELEALLSSRKRDSSPRANYPRSVINRLVDRWVN